MLSFVALCLLARLCYSLNDVLVGRLARRMSRLEVAAFRGASLGITMAPWLLFVPAEAWAPLCSHTGKLALAVSLTATANLLQFHAARHLPFGLRAAVMLSSMALSSVLLGWGLLGEVFTPWQIGLCGLLIASAVGVAVGSYSPQEIVVNVPRGAVLTALAALLIACAMVNVKRLAEVTHPLLSAWAWEFGSGLVLLGPALFRARTHPLLATWSRARRIGISASPTAIASGASVLAFNYGQLGLWGALGATQILFTATLGALWHHEKLGLRRWTMMGLCVCAVAALAMFGS